MGDSAALVVHSGGQDSTTCLYFAKLRHDEIHTVTFDYGQRHKRELDAAARVAALADVADMEVVQLGPVLKSTSPLVSDTELEQYKSHRDLPGGLEKTFVPMRNMLFLTIAANRAYIKGIRHIYTGVASEDYGGYPDCRRPFVDAVMAACNLGAFTNEYGAPANCFIHTPLMNLSKRQTVLMAMSLPGCYEALAYTHTAYDGDYPPTGHDHATLLRAKGFEEAGIPDPLVLRAVYHELMLLPATPNYDRRLPFVDECCQRIYNFLEKD